MSVRRTIRCAACRTYSTICDALDTANEILKTAVRVRDVIYEEGYDDATEKKQKRLINKPEEEEETEE